MYARQQQPPPPPLCTTFTQLWHATGAQWTSFWHASQTHAGGSTATVAAPLFETPVFVRAGSILPLRAAGPALCHSDATEVP